MEVTTTTSTTWPWGGPPPDARDRRAYADAALCPFWLYSPVAPPPRDPLPGDVEADLAIVGGGLSGLWAAVQAKQLDPASEVVLLERDTIGHGATGRSG